MFSAPQDWTGLELTTSPRGPAVADALDQPDLTVSASDPALLHDTVPESGERNPPSPPLNQELKLGQLTPNSTDRLFPIRSAISVDPTVPTNTARMRSNGTRTRPSLSRTTSHQKPGESGPATEGSINEAEPMSEMAICMGKLGSSLTNSIRGSCHLDALVEDNPPDSQSSARTSDISRVSRIPNHGNPSSYVDNHESNSVNDGMNSRFKHTLTADGHAIIIGEAGDPIQNCEDEPLQFTGQVQTFGLLLALQDRKDGILVPRVVSENCEQTLGYSFKTILELEDFCEVLPAKQAEILLDHIGVLKDGDPDCGANGPDVFALSIRSIEQKILNCWCAIHLNPNNKDLIICEFELQNDLIYPLSAPAMTAQFTPTELDRQPARKELADSTRPASKPLRILKGARRRGGAITTMEIVDILSQVQEQLASAANLEESLGVLVGIVKELTGFHRVMVYQFDHAWNGQVVAELVDERVTGDLYKGLHFPASDIPSQARELYLVNRVRLLYDRDLKTARLVYRSLEDLKAPLDLTHSYLRAMSPVHIKYLRNMGVRASMSISINAFGKLWGLIACHAHGTDGMRVSFPIRQLCRIVGDTAARNIERLSYISRLEARRLVNPVSADETPSGYILSTSEDLLELFDADYGLLSIHDETKIFGKLEQSQEALALLEYLRVRKITSVFRTTDVREEFPDLQYEPGFKDIAGLLLAPLSASGTDFIVFYRREQSKSIKWAGNPHEKQIKEGTESYMEPRKSFQVWNEIVHGTCRDWTDEQIETAAVLCLVYGKFIEAWRQKEAVRSSQMTRLLISNSAHEVRTPLNAIINYLEIALESPLNQETREYLQKSHSASKSLVYVINDLLDLTKAEVGQDLVKGECFDLKETIKEVTDVFKGDAESKRIAYDVVQSAEVPDLVIGDQRHVRQAVSNLTANAIQHTSTGGVKIEVWLASSADLHVEVSISIQDSGRGMSAEKLDALYRDLEQVEAEAEEPDEAPLEAASPACEPGQAILGLGLAVVARIVRNMGGQLRLSSEEHKGSLFIMHLPFELPPDSDGPRMSPFSRRPSYQEWIESARGETVLVNTASPQLAPSVRSFSERKSSMDSLCSLHSWRSHEGGRNRNTDAERVVEPISEPHLRTTSQHDDQNARSGGTRYPDGRSFSQTEFLPILLINHRLTSAQKPLPSKRALEISKKNASQINVKEITTNGPVTETAQVGCTELSHTSQTPQTYPLGSSCHTHRASQSFNTGLDGLTAEGLSILVAEDDPINSRLLKRRLEKLGHKVKLSVNGQECSRMYAEEPASFDVVLMDIQMPIVDGITSTEMIRKFENANPSLPQTPRSAANGRVPIFAVSASLLERDQPRYLEAGFDGWVMKPIDFSRLTLLFAGLVDEEKRQMEVYGSRGWEQGGWFRRRRPSADSRDDVGKERRSGPSQPPQSEARVVQDANLRESALG